MRLKKPEFNVGDIVRLEDGREIMVMGVLLFTKGSITFYRYIGKGVTIPNHATLVKQAEYE
jgi:hypothetical protein